MNAEDQIRFERACGLVMNAQHSRVGIGTLGEKTLHATLKYYLEPDDTRHEQKLGRYYADIMNGGGIVEVQTRGFAALRGKLQVFLETSVVTVVYPVAHVKQLVWLDPETGEATKKRKSPKIGTPCEIFPELYRIKPLLSHPNLRLCILLIDLTEYRSLDGWSKDRKKGSTRYERIPEKLADELHIDSPQDYRKLLPDGLPPVFTSKDFKKCSGLSLHNAQGALNICKTLGVITQSGKLGNAFTYELCHCDNA